MAVPGTELALQILHAVCTALLAGLTVWLARRSTPATLSDRVARAENAVGQFAQDLERIDRQRAAYKLEVQGLIEQAEDLLDRVERKRASTAASASRAQSASAAPLQAKPTTREEWKNYARRAAAGLG